VILADRVKVADHAPQFLAGEGSRARRTARRGSGAGVRGSARGTARCAAACRRTVPTETWRPGRRGRPKRASASARPTYSAFFRRSALRWGSTISSGSSRFWQRAAPRQQGRRLERHAGAIFTGRWTAWPATRTTPAKGNCNPVASFIRVDLPQRTGRPPRRTRPHRR